MGCTLGRAIYNSEILNGDNRANLNWIMKADSVSAKRFYINEGSLSATSQPGDLELRALLDTTYGAEFLQLQFVALGIGEVYCCWCRIYEFKNTPSIGNATLVGECLRNDGYLANNFPESCRYSEVSHCDVNDQRLLSYYDSLQHKCFNVMAAEFSRISQSEEYSAMCRSLLKKCNYVQAGDFEYMECIGKGTY